MIKSAKKFIRSFGEGARAIIWFDWDTKKTGLNYGHALKLGTVKIMRVDNLNLTNVVKRCAMNRE